MSDPLPRYTLPIHHRWDGAPLPEASHAQVELAFYPEQLSLGWDAPYAGDPAPQHPPGPTPQLWEYEVLEVFLLGDGGQYLELEFGPHGHYLALSLSGLRQVQANHRLEYPRPQTSAGRFRGQATVARSLLPAGPLRANAYRIHSQAPCHGEAGRCYHAHAPVPGPHPDFHRTAYFVMLCPP